MFYCSGASCGEKNLALQHECKVVFFFHQWLIYEKPQPTLTPNVNI